MYDHFIYGDRWVRGTLVIVLAAMLERAIVGRAHEGEVAHARPLHLRRLMGKGNVRYRAMLERAIVGGSHEGEVAHI